MHRLQRVRVLVGFILAASACVAVTAPQSTGVTTQQGFTPAQQFEIVDCLFPGQVRSVGGRVYMTPRRPGRTTVGDCALRGGEFTLYDRANTRASLNVWLPEANGGNAKAQTYVGMLHEKGVDGPPDYDKAVDWYRKAAAQGYSHAQYSIGTMYERGLGVEKDVNEAFNWYRKAQGVSDDDLVFESAMEAALEEQRQRLKDLIGERQQEVDVLRNQVEQLGQDSSASSNTIATMQRLLDAAQSEHDSYVAEAGRLPPPSTRKQATITPISPAEARQLGDRRLGRFYAVIIGIQDYQPFPSLNTVDDDIDRAERILRDKYGFSITRLHNPSRYVVLETINQYHDELGENDNLLIYFAGRGEILKSAEQDFGYWLPSDAQAPPNDTFWIANELMTGHLERINAKRILVVSDSTFVNLPESSPGLSSYYGQVSAGYLKITLPKRSRQLLASGEAFPVAADSGTYSRFAGAFLDVLEENQDLLNVPALFSRLRERLTNEVAAGAAEPYYRTIKAAQHELGDFFFLPSNLQ